MNALKVTCSILLLLGFTSNVLSQDIGEAAGWEIVERCLGEFPYPTIPQSNWDFEGVIISEVRAGIHAIRSDLDTSYFIALSSGNSFTRGGRFSPDGRWFAYPIGNTQYMSMMWDRANITRLRVVSTAPHGTYYEIPWINEENASMTIERLIWIDNETLVSGGRPDRERKPEDRYPLLINAFTGETEPAPVNFTLPNLHPLQYTSVIHEPTISFQIVPEEGVFIVRADGSQIRIIPADKAPAHIRTILSPNEQYALAYVGSLFYLIDIEQQVIYNLCDQRQLSYGSWSPDNETIAFMYDGYPVLYNIENHSMEILRYRANAIIAWFPVEAN